MASKYLKNSEGIVRAITSDNLQLEKPLLNENYDIEVHNRNMDKIDSAIQEIKGKVDGLELTAQRVSIADSTNKFEATNVEDALLENKTSILNNTNLANQALTKANEAFQRGDNVKSQLVDRLISEGLDVSTNNTFEELIGNIALGEKWASGSGTASNSKVAFTYSIGTDTFNFNYVDIPVSFVPSVIVVSSYYSSSREYITIFNNEGKLFSKSNVKLSAFGGATISATNYNFKANEKVILGNNVYRLPIMSESLPLTWIAFE